MEKTEYAQAFLENANEAATKIREIYHIFGGMVRRAAQKMVCLVLCMSV